MEEKMKDNIWQFKKKTLKFLKKEEKEVKKELDKLDLLENKELSKEHLLEKIYLKQFFHNKYQLLRNLIYGEDMKPNYEWNQLVDKVTKEKTEWNLEVF